jgi:hypothetical protein
MKYILLLVLCVTLGSCHSDDDPKPTHIDYNGTWYYENESIGLEGHFTISSTNIEAESFTLFNILFNIEDKFLELDGDKPEYISLDSEDASLQFQILSGNYDKLRCSLTAEYQGEYTVVNLNLTR